MIDPSVVRSVLPIVCCGTEPTIWLVWAWSAVTMTRVSPSALANSRAAATASSRSIVSPICPHTSAEWLRLSMEAPSTWRKKPLSALESSRKSIAVDRSEEHTSELQSRFDIVCRLLLEKKKYQQTN